MGWTNNRFGIARETSYGTAVTAGVKGYAATTEQFDPEMVENSVPGFRANRQGLVESEHSLVLVGGTGSITVPVPVDENDLLFDDILGAHTDFTGNAWAEATDSIGPDEGRTLYMVRGLCSENNVVGFDLVELNPLVDPGYTTMLNAKKIVDECMTGIALRKLGLGNRDYLSPLTRDDGRR